MNTDNQINIAIGFLWASFIENINFDLWNLQISFDLLIYEADNARKHKLVFDSVSSFFFVNGEGDTRFNGHQWENAELSEIHYFKTPMDHIKHKSDKVGTPQFATEPNFYIEIWDTVLMIEAKAIVVDNIKYVVIED
jgi:hypothetical protein